MASATNHFVNAALSVRIDTWSAEVRDATISASASRQTVTIDIVGRLHLQGFGVPLEAVATTDDVSAGCPRCTTLEEEVEALQAVLDSGPAEANAALERIATLEAELAHARGVDPKPSDDREPTEASTAPPEVDFKCGTMTIIAAINRWQEHAKALRAQGVPVPTVTHGDLLTLSEGAPPDLFVRAVESHVLAPAKYWHTPLTALRLRVQWWAHDSSDSNPSIDVEDLSSEEVRDEDSHL